jgi:membrane-associated phospholipid phosphatase
MKNNIKNPKKTKQSKNPKQEPSLAKPDKSSEFTLTRLIYYTIFGAIFVFLVYYILGKGDDIRFSQNFHQLFINNQGYRVSQFIGIFFSTKLWLVLMVLAWILGIFAFKDQPKLKKSLLWFGLSVLIAAFAAGILKIVIGRYRPYASFHNPALGNFKHFCMKDMCHSSPSGHTALSFAALFCISRIYQKWWVALICALLAAIIALSRIVVWDHYLSDVIFGFYIGLLSVYWAQWILRKRLN